MGKRQCLDKIEVIPYIFKHLLLQIISPFSLSTNNYHDYIFRDVVIDNLFSYRNALCSWWSLQFCVMFIHTVGFQGIFHVGGGGVFICQLVS